MAPAQSNYGQDEHAIRGVFADMVNAWNRHEMHAWHPLFTEDADFVNIGGVHLKGWAEIEGHHVAIHRGHYKDSRLTVTSLEIRFLRPDVAVAHLGSDVIYNNGADRRSAYGLGVLTKQNNQWLIATFHNVIKSGPSPK